jgi:hypothetical protein
VVASIRQVVTSIGAAMILGEILGDRAEAGQQPANGPSHTIDQLFHRLAARQPDAVALVDAPNRETFTDGAPRRLTFAAADRMISAIAGRLLHMGLPTDAVVGIQLPNTVENILTILGVLRAGMIAAPLPLLWRRADGFAALTRAGAKALITCRRVGNFSHGQFATHLAADVFSIRYVCGFGPDPPDGVVTLDDLFTAAALDPIPPLDRDRKGNAAAHLAVITFESGADGPLPVARRHLELLAGGMSVLLESKLEQGSSILSTIAPASFPGICLTLVPWLLSGGTLVLHHPFDADTFARQRHDEDCPTLILPGPVAFALADSGLFATDGPTTILAAWPAPERLAGSADWVTPHAALVDIPIFGEAGLVAARRDAGGRPEPIVLGPVTAPRAGNGTAVVEFAATASNTLALRGAMVPHHSFPPGIERSDQPHFAIGHDGWVDSGYGCWVNPIRATAVITTVPAGMVSVGGYRLPLQGLTQVVSGIDSGASLSVVPDPLIGHRLVGQAADGAAMVAALDALGINPLVASAFAAAGASMQSTPALTGH